ncbi:MAG: energy-coupling factor transporter ATPase [Actinobacteria bacterium HGW-Actinobacteria-7]|nr:MAG: energy-coupling factor transporter ATPase [Actinobacteria bacterium HGW-Actinobacteria-7]
MSLSLVSIGYTYGRGTSFGMRALHDVSLEVAPGELVLVLGATGSGKSTLLRIAAGLLRADEGEAVLDGVSLDRGSARGVVGLIFQDAESQLFADTVLEDVAFGPRNMGASREEALASATESLRAVGLDPATFKDRSPFSLSGGEARRVAIAGVLAFHPRYLLADEPTAGLDAKGRRAMRSLLLEARAKAGVVVVSHGAEEFLADADRVIVLSGGGCALSSTPRELVATPSMFDRVGLRAPDVLEVQRLAASRRSADMPYTLDPAEAARSLTHGGGQR